MIEKAFAHGRRIPVVHVKLDQIRDLLDPETLGLMEQDARGQEETGQGEVGDRMNEHPTPMALVYDFDGTLAPGRMQDHQFIPNTIKMDVEEFWDAVHQNIAQHQADPILSYMYVMLERSRAAGVEIHRSDLEAVSRQTRFFPGVEGWFRRTNAYATHRGVRWSTTW